LEIEGKKADFVFDSASSAISVSKSLAQQLSTIRYTGDLKYYTDATGHIYSENAFILPEVKAGNYLAKKILGKNYKPWGLCVTTEGKLIDENKEKADEDGLVGLDFFNGENIIIDYSCRKIIVLKKNVMPKAYAKLNWLSIPFSYSNNEFKIKAIIDNQLKSFLLDTGSTGSFLKKPKELTITNINSQSPVIKEIFISKERVGSFKFLPVDYEGITADGILGHDFFLSNVIYIDFKNKLMKLKRHEDSLSSPIEMSPTLEN